MSLWVIITGSSSPFLKEKGVKNVFIDTDGDFNRLIPDFIEAGVDGFLPMDVNAGMDIVKVRQLSGAQIYRRLQQAYH